MVGVQGWWLRGLWGSRGSWGGGSMERWGWVNGCYCKDIESISI